MNTYIKLLVFTISLILSYTAATAQVTIGSDTPPVEGSILQIKTIEPQDGYTTDLLKNTTSKNGGIILPLVQLTDLNSLSSLIGNASEEDIKALTGLIVYHTGSANIPNQGIYYWDDNKWNLIHEDYINSSAWYEVGTSRSAKLNTQNIYLNANAVINDTQIENNINPVDGNTLTIYGNDISINGVRLGNGSHKEISNIVFGNEALSSTSSSTNNIALGHKTLSDTGLTGSNNNAVGVEALTAVTTGNNNVAAGYKSGNTLTTGSNNILLGNDTQVSANNTSQQINIANTVYGDITTNRVGINTSNPQATLDVNGKIRATERGAISEANILRIDDNGIIKKSAITPRKVVYIASSSSQSIARTNINNAEKMPITWEAGSVLINNDIISSTNTAVNELTIIRDGVYEISGFVSYNPQAVAPSGSTPPSEASSWVAGVILEIQYKKSGSSDWIPLMNVQATYSAGALLQPKEIHLQPMGVELGSGDTVRMVLYRPTSSYALSHGSSSQNPSISKLTESKYTKMLKIVSL